MALQPFRIDFGEAAIADLQRRIDETRWPSIPFATGWSAGTDDDVLRDLVRYWRSEFDWFEVQDSLNRLTHLRGPVGDADEALHCVVLGQGGEGRTPLLLLHGWPGSFIELLPAAELLAQGVDGAPGFEVVVPSLPGYGFSEAAREPGMHPGRIAERMHALMTELGHERYGVQGGDWGSIVGARLTHQQPQSVLGLHLNFPAGLVQSPADAELPAEEAEWREQMAEWRDLEGAYGHIQGTKPQTLAYSLNDSPVGLLAWILEKFRAWSEPRELWEIFDRDAVLANVTLYWLTGHGAVRGAHLLREPPRVAAVPRLVRPARADGVRALPSASRGRRPARSSSAPTASCAGASRRAAVTSRRWNSRSCSLRTWPRSSQGSPPARRSAREARSRRGGRLPSAKSAPYTEGHALVAQWIEHRPPEPGAQVRVLPRVPTRHKPSHGRIPEQGPAPASRCGLDRVRCRASVGRLRLRALLVRRPATASATPT